LSSEHRKHNAHVGNDTLEENKRDQFVVAAEKDQKATADRTRKTRATVILVSEVGFGKRRRYAASNFAD
jgi:hypothetical protein